MINRENWALVKEYLQYREHVDLLSLSSIRLETTWLRQVLEWADVEPFSKANSIRPTLPEYLLSVNRYGEVGKLSPIYVKKVIAAGKHFFLWLSKHNKEYSWVPGAWLDTLRQPRMENGPKEHEAVTFEYVIQLANSPAVSLRERRVKAAAAFWFLSGIRIGAFVSLPIKAVDIPNRTIYQWPSLGVKTKFMKRSTTFLINIPVLTNVIETWDDEIRSIYPAHFPWFVPLSPTTSGFDPNISLIGDYRTCRAAKDLRAWTTRLGLPYHSPHKFRHGFAVYAIKRAKDIADLKAVSQNLMHSNLSITDGVYGVLSTTDVGERIARLAGEAGDQTQIPDSLLNDLAELISQLRKQSL